MDALSLSQSLLLLSIAAFLYLVLGSIYRLYLCPTARFPGPRLAALTFWYEFYYDVVCKGRYTWKIQKLHEKYGPIVRINPAELHVIDPNFYDSVYVGPSRRTEKWAYSARMFGTSLAAVGTTGHELHRLRRSALNGFFSKRSISKLESKIQRVVDHACSSLHRRAAGKRVLNLRNFFAAFSADLIGEVAFGSNHGLLGRPEFEPGWQRLMMDLSRSTHLMKHFPWAYTILNSIPPPLVSIFHPVAKRLFDIRNDIRLKIQQTKASSKGSNHWTQKEEYKKAHTTVLDRLLTTPTLPNSELALSRLEDEAFTLLGAGTVTTAHTLTTIIYHVLANPDIKCKMELEISSLYSTMPTSRIRPNLQALEHAPYLSAIISEGLRLSFGVSHRLPRISPDMALHYHGVMNGEEYDYIIPPGVPVSMTQMIIHLDPSIYPSPHSFIPDRWLSSNSETEAEREQLRRRKQFLIPFSRGTRMCAGMHLAFVELYLMLGALFAPTGVGKSMKLFETDVKDVECAHDFFNPSPRLDSQGVRVLLKETTVE